MGVCILLFVIFVVLMLILYVRVTVAIRNAGRNVVKVGKEKAANEARVRWRDTVERVMEKRSVS